MILVTGFKFKLENQRVDNSQTFNRVRSNVQSINPAPNIKPINIDDDFITNNEYELITIRKIPDNKLEYTFKNITANTFFKKIFNSSNDAENFLGKIANIYKDLEVERGSINKYYNNDDR